MKHKPLKNFKINLTFSIHPRNFEEISIFSKTY